MITSKLIQRSILKQKIKKEQTLAKVLEVASKAKPKRAS